MSPMLHHDQALQSARDQVMAFVAKHRKLVERAVLLDDLFGQIRLLLATKGASTKLSAAVRALSAEMEQATAPYWARDAIWLFDLSDREQDSSLFDAAWRQGTPVASSTVVRVSTRVRDHSGWFVSPMTPPWPAPSHIGATAKKKRSSPPIVAFISFKGGVGRTTSLAAFAIQRARLGERVLIVDLDLDAPGVGLLFDDDPPGTTATHGVVDFLLERPLVGEAVDIEEYVHRCRRLGVVGDGSIIVMPAGRVGYDYLSRLARVDLELQPGEIRHPVIELLHAVRDLQPTPHWILLDGRAGLSEVAGILTSGIAHLHVLLATASEQGFAGIERFVHRLGAERLLAPGDLLQGDTVIVQTMTPARQRNEAVPLFRDRVAEIFRSNYFTDQSDPEDRFWSVDDIDNEEGPHQPVVVSYREEYAFFGRIDEIAERLAQDPDYRQLSERIVSRFPEAVAKD